MDPEPILSRIQQVDLVAHETKLFRETTNESALDTLALTYRQSGLINYTKSVLEALVSRGSSNPATLNNLGLVYYDLGDLDAAHKLFKKANDLDLQLSPDTAVFLPASRNLHGIEPEFRAIRRVRGTGQILWIISAVIVLSLLFIFVWKSAAATSASSASFLSNLLQVDGFLYAFVGAFAIFVLGGFKSVATRNAALTYVLLPLFAYISLSTICGLLVILANLSAFSVSLLVPFALMIFGMAHSLLLAFLIRVLPFTPAPQ